ncbi:MAG: NTP transferase domain-containing protein [Eubacterium sp.]
MKYIIMADGKGRRWKNYKGIPKHLAVVQGETLLGRTVRLLKQQDPAAVVIITSHDERCSVPGAVRYEPLHNRREIDRFIRELIEDDVCFLYGDTWYEEDAIRRIMSDQNPARVGFYGSGKDIAAVKVHDSGLFRAHVKIIGDSAIPGIPQRNVAWKVWYSIWQSCPDCTSFTELGDEIRNINTPDEYRTLESEMDAVSDDTDSGLEDPVTVRCGSDISMKQKEKKKNGRKLEISFSTLFDDAPVTA